MRKTAVLIAILLFLVPAVTADGMIFIEDYDMWNLRPEQNQLAAIHYENGVENLLISVTPGEAAGGTRAVWLFPVPAQPENVQIDVLKGYPAFSGHDISTTYDSAVGGAAMVQIAYATFPVSVVCGGAAAIIPLFAFGMAGSIQKASFSDGIAGIDVHERIERMGVTTEVVTATDAHALETYLATLGMPPLSGNEQYLADYTGRDYSFVISYISNMDRYREASGTGNPSPYYDYGSPYSGYNADRIIGVFVRFPTDRIYYPLRPTAVYGSRQVPVLLYVTGFVDPVLYDSIRSGSEVTFFTDDHFTATPGLAPFFNGKTGIDPLKYTKIKIDVPAERFTADLWMAAHPPAAVAWKEIFLQFSVLISVLVYIIFSAVSSLAAGHYAFRKKTVGAKTLLLHGLWNCATFIGLAIVTRKKFPQEEYGRRGRYILAFYVTFAALLSAYVIVLSPSLAPVVGIGWVFGLLSPLLALFLLFVPVMFFTGAHYYDAGSLIVAIVMSIVLVMLALCPVPALLWLKRWLDPA